MSSNTSENRRFAGDIDLEIQGEAAKQPCRRDMVVAVKPKTVERGALFLIPAAAIVGVIAVSTGHWIVLVAMVLVILGQGLAVRKARGAGAPRQ